MLSKALRPLLAPNIEVDDGVVVGFTLLFFETTDGLVVDFFLLGLVWDIFREWPHQRQNNY